jgi:protein SCO1
LNRRATLATLLCACAYPHAAQPESSDWIVPGPRVPDVTLVDQDGADHRFSALVAERPIVMNFFFTGCQTVCPVQFVQLKLLQSMIARSPTTTSSPLILSIALNPLSDTPEAMTEFISHFDVSSGIGKAWLFLTGGFEDLGPVWNSFEQSSFDPSQHTGLFWIGQPTPRRWSRMDAAASPDFMMKRLQETG